MNPYHTHDFSCWLSSFLKVSVAAGLVATMTACAAISGPDRSQGSPLPINTSNTTGGFVASTRAFETSERLYVAGSLHRPRGYHFASAAHVDVQLLDQSGRILAEDQDDIDLIANPRTTGNRSRRSSYVVSFPLDLARRAASIRVSYHQQSHGELNSSGASLR